LKTNKREREREGEDIFLKIKTENTSAAAREKGIRIGAS